MVVLLANFALHAVNSTLDPHPVNVPTDQRSLWNILWGCVVTIFACTWIAIHPNIPAADDLMVVIAFRRVVLMLCGIVAPEIIILWAMRQWYSARRIGQVHKNKGWTTTHGFFIQMGGFVMYDQGQPPYPIQLHELEIRHASGDIDWPQITELEIQDRSKGDVLSKGLVIFQTSWFLVQCIGRGCVGLAITELELITLAFASLNVVTYFFWWNKPVDVRCPYPIHPKQHISTDDDNVSGIVTGNQGSVAIFRGLATSFLRSLWSFMKLLIPPVVPLLRNKRSRLLMTLAYIQRPPSLLLKFLLKGALAIKGSYDTQEMQGRVPTLYAAQLDSNSTIFFVMTLLCAFIGSVFGAIHCIAWSFHFPSHRDKLLWRVSSLIITCTPFPIALLSNDMSHMQDTVLRSWIGQLRGSQSTPRGTIVFRPRQSNDNDNEISFTHPHILSHTSIPGIIVQDGTEQLSDISPPLTAEKRVDEPSSARINTDPRVQSANIMSDLTGINYLAPVVDDLETCTTASQNIKSERFISSWWRIDLRRALGVILKRWCNSFYSWCHKLSFRKFPCAHTFLRWMSSTKEILMGTAIFQPESRLTSWGFFLMTFIWVIKCILLAGLTSAYAIARLVLIVQALRALTDLPPEALQTMEWTSFIPHV